VPGKDGRRAKIAMRAAETAVPGPAPGLSRDEYLYPPLAPARSGRLPLDGLHTMHWEECGNPRGVPVVFLHGGPGGGSTVDDRRYYDPAFYRIVLFDQRGAGQSTPLGGLTDNTTQHLLGDLERLRGHLAVERWLVFGGSWGSTLALAYAAAHPHRVLGLVLRGVFLARASEICWFMAGMRSVFPEAWHAFAGFLPEADRGDILAAYYRRLTHPDPALHLPAARAWSRYESSCSTLLPDPDLLAHCDADATALATARIEAHYFVHGFFLAADTLLEAVERLRQIPCCIVQGRYDIVCPICTADDLHRAWTEAEYVIVPDAGHSARETGIARELVAATDRFRARLA
jgi:proline iminopeptidase